jgi:hypothetical protein
MKSVNSFKKLVFEGASAKSIEINDLVLDRLNYEISVIEKLGLTEYFTGYLTKKEFCVPMEEVLTVAHLLTSALISLK